MGRPTNEERDRRAQERAERDAQVKQSGEFGGTALHHLQDQLDDANARDERKPNWRPATLLNIETQEVAPDEREMPGDLARAANQMAGRAAFVENHDNTPWLTQAKNPPVVPNLHNLPPGEGDEIQLRRGYQPADDQGAPDGPKRVKGEVIKVPPKEARRLVNLGVAKFTEV